MKSDLLLAVNQLAGERNLPILTVVAAIEEALAAAYKKDASNSYEVKVQIDPESGDVEINTVLEVVPDGQVEDSNKQIALSDAQHKEKGIAIGDLLRFGSLEYSQGRIAAQNTKQVVLQRLREAERELAFKNFEEKQGSMSLGTVYRNEKSGILVDIDHNIAVMPPTEQSPAERYRTGQQIQVLITKVERTLRGPEITVSRSSPLLLMRLFEKEVPEVSNGAIEIKAIAREAGSRSKIAVQSNSKDIDAVGACVGLRGIRIHNIVNEVMGEKIDVVQWDEDPSNLIQNALNPASVEKVVINQDTKTADVFVAANNLSLAIGKEGKNVRLVGKLTGWALNIESYEVAEPAAAEKTKKEKKTTPDKAAVEQPATEEQTKASSIKKLEKELQELEKKQPKKEEAVTAVAQSQPQDAPAEEQTDDSFWGLDDDLGDDQSQSEGLRFAEDIKELNTPKAEVTKTRPKRKKKPTKGRGR